MDSRGAIAFGMLAVGLLLVAAPGCAVNPVTGRSELAIVSLPEEEEAALLAKSYEAAGDAVNAKRYAGMAK